ncbi:hypothetical protein [Arcticibacterium luteifluviistationis]|nr:hypothetical protein [Arcticibacterium luteifluviistationis]
MIQKPDKLLLIAMFIGLVFHGTIFFFTFDSTYDAFVHIFFADHYSRSWFEPWDNRWYTGFNVTSYPPLVHQLTALLSKLIGLKYAFVFMAAAIVQLLIVGAYRFSKLWTTPRAAGYAAIFACFCSSIVEALHLFGQLPTLMGIACLLNALPEVYRWMRYGKYYRLATAISIMGVGVTSHHVTTIFGMVFFIAPVMGLAVVDTIIAKNKDVEGADKWYYSFVEENVSKFKITLRGFLVETWNKRKELVLFVGSVPIIMMLIFPYFYWSATDPINQVSIPHGSRDSFIEVTSSGLMFFLIPMGIILLLMPYIFIRVWTRRNFFIGLSFSLMVLLGTGGTTPLPKLMLGENAFNILTLDRFTFWATIISIPFIGEFFYRLLEADLKDYLREKLGVWPHRLSWILLASILSFLTIFIINLGTFRPLQPQSIDMKPMLQFLERDQHDKWRYMTLGFGDQMAWLSAQTKAQSVDGNYHSARRLPEMTTRPLERLENSKFKGVQGLGSLQQFLTVPEKYYLKYVFSNDKFYDPILYFSGWERVQRLENGIMVWQKQDVPPLPSALKKKELPKIMKIWWGIMPILSLLIALGVNFVYVWYTRIKKNHEFDDEYRNDNFLIAPLSKWTFIFMGTWIAVIVTVTGTVIIKGLFHSPYDDPESVVEAYYDAVDFKYFGAAYEFFEPETRPSFEDYFIKLSVEDGIVASYAKLDNMIISTEKIDKNNYLAKVDAEWITPVEQYMTHNEHRVTKVKGKWYIIAPKFDNSIPPDTFVEESLLSMHSQGKRQTGTDPTQHDDVMDRPELKILNARLVKKDSTYTVVGELQNIDNYPAHITVLADLYDQYNRKLVSYNVKYGSIHRIMPKEVVSFRINFESTAWVKTDDLDPGEFNPEEFTEYDFPMAPVKFKILARAVIDKNDLYRSVGLQNVHISNNTLEAEGFNYGTEEVSVPKVLVSYYDNEDKVKWVEVFFMREGIRQQRKRKLKHKLADFTNYSIVYEGTEADFYVNGLPSISYISVPQTKELTHKILLGNKEKLGLRIDGYLGSPTIY